MLHNDIENLQPEIHQPDLTNDRLEAIAKYIETLTVTATLQIGARLAEAREIFRYRRDEGGFAGWVETRLGYSRQHAYNFLHVYERFGVQEVSKCFDTLARSVVFLVSAPGTPREAGAEIIERAKSGESMPVAEAKRIIAAAKGSRAKLGKDAVAAREDTAREQDELVKLNRRVASRTDVAEHALLMACQACDNLDDVDMSVVPQARRTDLSARISEAVATLLRLRNQLAGPRRLQRFCVRTSARTAPARPSGCGRVWTSC